MSSAGDPMSRPTNILVEASEILRALKPSTLGTLLVIYSDDTLTQEDIGDAIGCARSTVSKYLQSLDDLALAKKGSQRYTVTDIGEEVIGLMVQMFEKNNTDLFSVNWGNDSEKEEIAALLTPLYDSRSVSSFFILNSLYKRSGAIGRLGGPRTIQIEDVVQDVEARQIERGESTTTEQVRQKLRRFDDARVIEFDGREIMLIEKGQEHGRILAQLADYLMDQEDTEDRANESEESASIPDSSASDGSEIPSTIQTNSSVEMYGRNVSQNDIREYLASKSSSSVIESQDAHLPTIIPAYYLRSANEGNSVEGSDSRSQQSPILPLTSLTIGELADHINRLVNEYSEDTKIDPYWTIQTESGYIPVYPAIPQRDLRASGPDNP